MAPLATPVYSPCSFEHSVRPEHSGLGTFRAVPGWPFRVFTGTPSNVLTPQRHTDPTGRTHSEVPSIDRLYDLSTVQMRPSHVASVLLTETTVFQDIVAPSYMTFTLPR